MAQAVADVLDNLSNLPPFPKVTTRLIGLLDDDMASYEDLSKIISSDPSLAMNVIKMSNSPFYMLSAPIENVKDAVIILGIDTLKGLTTAISIQKGLSKLQPRSGIFNMASFWKHSYAVGIGAGKLAESLKRESYDKFYLAGLIHDMGKLIQAYFWPESWKAAINILKAGDDPFENIEKRIFGWPHLEITISLCENWRFPNEILAILKSQHQVAEEKCLTQELQGVLRTADLIAISAGYQFPTEEVCENQSDDLDQYSEIVNTLSDEVNYQLNILGA